MSSIKEQLIREVDENKEYLLKLCSEIIQIPSENPGGSQREVIDYVKKFLESIDVEHEELGPNPDHPCIFAKLGNPDGYGLIFNGHVDVVPAGDRSQWDFDPFSGEITDTRILGRGTSDMKCGVAAVLFALYIIKKCKLELKGNIKLHIVSDEETSGKGTRWFCENGYADGSEACIVAEPTSKTIEIGQKGKVGLKIISKGESAHGSLGGFKGENAILKLCNVLGNLSQLTDVEGTYREDQKHALESSHFVAEKELGKGVSKAIDHLSVNVGIIRGGNAINMVPDYCEAEVDIRVPLGLSREEVEKAIEACFKGVDGISFEHRWSGDANATDEYDPLVQNLKRNAEELWGFDVIPAYQWASSDARYYREKGLATLQYGPSNTEGIHSYNEDVDILDVVNSAKIYLMTICDLLT